MDTVEDDSEADVLDEEDDDCNHDWNNQDVSWLDEDDEENEEAENEEADMEIGAEETDEVTIEDVEDRDEVGIIQDLGPPDIPLAPLTSLPQDHEPSAEIQAGFQQQALLVSENQILKLKEEQTDWRINFIKD